jgi:hypothetical protein
MPESEAQLLECSTCHFLREAQEVLVPSIQGKSSDERSLERCEGITRLNPFYSGEVF